MDYKEKLGEVRTAIDKIDSEMLDLFARRMELANDVADIKGKGNISLVDEQRENELIAYETRELEGALKGEATVFLRNLMALSKTRQRRRLFGVQKEVLLPKPREQVTENIKVGYQGVPGAWSEQAAIQVLPTGVHTARNSFEDVFIAVKDKHVHYGVVPLENSQSGAIGEVYDLLRKYGCYIVGQTWVSAAHCLMGLPEAELGDIREVYSHPEGFKQCEAFLRGRVWDLTACRNTAVAAELVAKKGEVRNGAIGSPRAAELNGLQILAHDITSHENNRTRFVVIADQPEYAPESNMVSVIFRTAHRSGALCDVLFAMMNENINVARIESRPVADEKYCFFVDLEGNIEDEGIQSALHQANALCGYLEVLGCYSKESALL